MSAESLTHLVDFVLLGMSVAVVLMTVVTIWHGWRTWKLLDGGEE